MSQSAPFMDPVRAQKAYMPQVEERFSYLRSFASVLRFLAILGLVVAGVGVALALTTPSTRYDPVLRETITSNPFSHALTIGAAGILAVLFLFATAQFIELQLAQEANQRVTNELLFRLMTRRRE